MTGLRDLCERAGVKGRPSHTALGALCREHGTSLRGLADALGLHNSMTNIWAHQRRRPSGQRVAEMAEHLGGDVARVRLALQGVYEAPAEDAEPWPDVEPALPPAPLPVRPVRWAYERRCICCGREGAGRRCAWCGGSLMLEAG